jgi:cation transporter-like permease
MIALKIIGIVVLLVIVAAVIWLYRLCRNPDNFL